MDVSFDYLRRLQLQERRSAGLVALDEGFYSSAQEFLRGLRKQLAEGDAGVARVLENSEQILREVFALRKKKIIFKALADASENHVTATGLAKEEKQLYTELVKLLREHEVFSSGKAPEERKDAVSVEFLVDLPEFAGLDSKSYGPFSKGDSAELGSRQAELLAKRGAVRII